MVYPQGHAKEGIQKGIQAILMERGLYDERLLLRCDKCVKNVTTRKSDQCCHSFILSQTPDFLSQREMLYECIAEMDDVFLHYLPKFHCELNPIELIWALLKQHFRMADLPKFIIGWRV